MALCPYCGQKAGWFRDVHPACVQRAQPGIADLMFVIEKAVSEGATYETVKQRLLRIVSECRIPEADARRAMQGAWDSAAAKKSLDHPLNRDEVKTMEQFYKDAGWEVQQPFSPGSTHMTSSLYKTVAQTQMTRSWNLWNVLHDEIYILPEPDSFILQPDEVPIETFEAELKQEQSTFSYIGGYRGVSVPIGHLGYVTLGGLQGHMVESRNIQHVDSGDLLFTTQNLYFAGSERGTNLRIPYSQIIRLQPYADAVGVCLTYGKEQILAERQNPYSPPAPCGWFLFNLLHALVSKQRVGTQLLQIRGSLVRLDVLMQETTAKWHTFVADSIGAARQLTTSEAAAMKLLVDEWNNAVGRVTTEATPTQPEGIID